MSSPLLVMLMVMAVGVCATTFPGSTVSSSHVTHWAPQGQVGDFAITARSPNAVLHPLGLLVGSYANVSLYRYEDGALLITNTTGSAVGARFVSASPAPLVVGPGAPFSSSSCKNMFQCLAGYSVDLATATFDREWQTPFPDGPGFTSWSVFTYAPLLDPDHTYIIGQYTTEKVALATGASVGTTSSSYIAFAQTVTCAGGFIAKYGASNSLNLEMSVIDTQTMTSYTPSLFGTIFTSSPAVVCSGDPASEPIVILQLSQSTSDPSYLVAYNMASQEILWKKTDMPTATFLSSTSVVRSAQGTDLVLVVTTAGPANYSLSALDAATGDLVWTHRQPFSALIPFSAVFIASPELVLLVGSTGETVTEIWALETTTGALDKYAVVAVPDIASITSLFGTDADMWCVYTLNGKDGTDDAAGIAALHLL